MKKDDNLLSAAVIVVSLRAINTSDRPLNKAFDALANELKEERSALFLNELAAVIFDSFKSDYQELEDAMQ